jgi:hypothetical protein
MSKIQLVFDGILLPSQDISKTFMIGYAFIRYDLTGNVKMVRPTNGVLNKMSLD